jgi:predicted XRE-type DNA-binding protein
MCYNELDIIDKLKVYQALNKLNQTQLGEKLNVSQPVISRVLIGHISQVLN